MMIQQLFSAARVHLAKRFSDITNKQSRFRKDNVSSARRQVLGYEDRRSADRSVAMKTLTLAIIGLAMAASGADAKPLAGGRYLAQAKVSLDQARATALKARPGQIADEELEKEKGGSGLRYSFDVKSGGKTYEVGVDAVTGKVLENSPEGAHPD
jgi:hypothetical protein